MTISVGPTKRKPTHNFSLSDGTTTLGLLNCTKQGILDSRAGWAQSPMPRTAMKLAQGAAKYEDFELPFTSIIQEDFSGGMLAENFEDDTTKFRDERHCDTTRGDIICGPKPTSTALIAKNGDLEYSDVEYLDYDVAWADTGNVIACPYTPAGNITVYAVDVVAPESPMQEYAQDDILYAKIYSESAGEPDTLLAFGQVQVPGNGVYRITLNTSVNLTGSTTYWIGVYLNMGNDYHVYVKRSETDIDIFRWVSDAWVRIEEDYSLAFNLISTSSPAKINLFEHRRVLYALLSYDDGTTAPKLYMNGYRGAVLSANANLTIINTAADLSEDDDGEELDLDGKVLLLIEGPGSDEEQPWRIITSNTVTGTNDTITVRQPWKTQPTTATGWVVLGTDD